MRSEISSRLSRLDRLLICFCSSLILLSLLLLYLAVTEKDRLSQAHAITHGNRIEAGAHLYSLHCRNCHGLKGEGVGQLGPALSEGHFFSGRLAEVGWQTSLENYITTTIQYGRMMGTRPMYAGNGSTAVMAPWHQNYGGPLRSDQINALTSFVLNWERTASGEVQLENLILPVANPEDPQVIARGERVFQNKCRECHTVNASEQAKRSGPDLTHIAKVAGERQLNTSPADYLHESILIPGAVIVEGYQDIDKNQQCGAVLTVSELQNITAFLLRK
jgi:cytochrome c2